MYQTNLYVFNVPWWNTDVIINVESLIAYQLKYEDMSKKLQKSPRLFLLCPPPKVLVIRQLWSWLLESPRFLQIRLRHESRDKYIIHISKTAFQKNVILKRRIIMWALWGSRTSHVVNDPPLSCFGATYWYVAIEVNFFPNFKLLTTHSYLIIF